MTWKQFIVILWDILKLYYPGQIIWNDWGGQGGNQDYEGKGGCKVLSVNLQFANRYVSYILAGKTRFNQIASQIDRFKYDSKFDTISETPSAEETIMLSCWGSYLRYLWLNSRINLLFLIKLCIKVSSWLLNVFQLFIRGCDNTEELLLFAPFFPLADGNVIRLAIR